MCLVGYQSSRKRSLLYEELDRDSRLIYSPLEKCNLWGFFVPAKIRVLSEETINQIAAGEIIENPASAIKELVENAIDAGSKRIVIDVRGGGHLFFEVSDDGCGMGRDDAVFCLERHATSKIREFADLSKLYSMGFRGEALASIAAVSKMEIETSDGNEGTLVVCHGGKIIKVEPCARLQGTTIRVSSLFYNFPAP